MSAIRLAAFDLDGTLLGDDLLTLRPRVQRAIAAALARGIHVTLATGRRFTSTRPFAEQLGITAPLICYQGAWIQALGDAAPRHTTSLPDAVSHAALALGAAEGWHTLLYTGGELILDALIYDDTFYRTLLAEEYAVGVPWQEALAGRPADKVLFTAEPDDIPAIGVQLRALLGDQAEIVRTHARFIEVIPAGVSKGRALAWLADYLSIPQAEVLAVGDQENDLEMIRWAGVGVAMGNADEQVRRAADWIAPSWDEDGAACALERFAGLEFE